MDMLKQTTKGSVCGTKTETVQKLKNIIGDCNS